MHASVWTFTGDPDDLLRRYEAMLADIPGSSMLVHLCMRTNDGIVVVDTCPSETAFQAFSTTTFPILRAKHALPTPEQVQDGPVHATYLDGHLTIAETVR
jgi:hypothetical protein